MAQSWVAASSAAWGCQSSKSAAAIPKSFGFKAATRYVATNQSYPKEANGTYTLIFRHFSVGNCLS